MFAVSCPLCGAQSASCGGQGTPHVGVTFGKVVQMTGKLEPYEVTVNGVSTTLMLTVEEAEARGYAAPKAKAAPKPANKARTAPNKG